MSYIEMHDRYDHYLPERKIPNGYFMEGDFIYFIHGDGYNTFYRGFFCFIKEARIVEINPRCGADQLLLYFKNGNTCWAEPSDCFRNRNEALKELCIILDKLKV